MVSVEQMLTVVLAYRPNIVGVDSLYKMKELGPELIESSGTRLVVGSYEGLIFISVKTKNISHPMHAVLDSTIDDAIILCSTKLQIKKYEYSGSTLLF